MSLGHAGVVVASPTVWALLLAVAPTAAAVEADPLAAATPAPELTLLAQHTFTGEVRDILIVDREVWAATGGGLAIHRRDDGAYVTTLTSADGLPGNSLRSLARVDEGHVMVGGDFGAAIVDVKAAVGRRANSIVKIGCDSGCTKWNPVYGIVATPEGPYLVRHHSGLEEWRRNDSGHWTMQWSERIAGFWRAVAVGDWPVLGGLDGRLIFRDGKQGTSFTLNAPVLALTARPGDAVVATGKQLLQARPDGVRTLVPRGGGGSPAATVLSAPDASGVVLVGTAQGGVWSLKDDVLTPIHEGLPGRVTALAADGDRVWLGLGRSGLHLVERGGARRSLRPAGEICDNHVIAIVRFAGHEVAGTFDQGACFFDAGAWRAVPGLPSPLVHGLGSDGQDLYVATSNGIARFDVRMQPRPIDRGDPVVLRWAAGSAATAVAQVGEGGLAITTAYGLIELRRTDRKLVATFTSHRAGAPMKLTAVASVGDEVWLGSETQGAKSMTKHGMRHVQDPEDLPENWVIALAASGSETLWVGTCQHGVARVDLRNPSTHRRFIDTRTILADDMVTALAADERGAFIGTLGGLAFAAAKGESGRAYGWQIGLPDLRSSALLLAGDELWLGTESGLARFRVR